MLNDVAGKNGSRKVWEPSLWHRKVTYVGNAKCCRGRGGVNQYNDEFIALDVV